MLAANADAEAGLLLAERWPEESRAYLLSAVATWRKASQNFEHATGVVSSQHKGQPDAEWFIATFPAYDFTDPAKQQ